MKNNVINNIKSWFMGNDLNTNKNYPSYQEPSFTSEHDASHVDGVKQNDKVYVVMYSDDRFGPSVVSVATTTNYLQKYIMEHFGGIQSEYHNEGFAVELSELEKKEDILCWFVTEVGYPQNLLGSYWVTESAVEH